MPEDLPKAVLVLLWLLIGTIVFGYLLMAHPTGFSILFATVYFGLPIYIHYDRLKNENKKSDD